MKSSRVSALFYTVFLIVIWYPLIGCNGTQSSKKNIEFWKNAVPVMHHVDPFIGTSEMGHTFPGATVPFGMVQLSPETDTIPFLNDGKYTGTVYRYCSGYQYADSTIVGFSHTHFSGTGHSDLGDVLLMPSVGSVQLNPGTANNPGSGYRSRFNHQHENAHPGYYGVVLEDDGILAELTATERVGIHRYTFPDSSSTGNVIIDLDAGIYDYPGKEIWSFMRVENDTLITGYKMTTGWAKTRTIYFAMAFSQPISQYGHERRDTPPYEGFWRRFDMSTDFPEMAGRQIVAWTQFDLDDFHALEVQVALSCTGIDGALNNLKAEASGHDFDALQATAEEKWEHQLGRIQIESMSASDESVFRTAQYHASLGPTIYSDVDGKYRGLDQRNHPGKDDWGVFENYSTFSLWDTYRALHPWFNLLEPDRNRNMIRSMLQHQAQSVHGMLPVWSHHANDNWCMIGYHSVSVLADAMAKNVIPNTAMAREMLAASVETASHQNFDGLDAYRDLGYVPCDRIGASVSKTLEMAYDDWCIAQMAESLGELEIRDTFIKRSRAFENVWDERIQFMRPRYSNGHFRADFDVMSTHGQGFIEGNAWNYSLHVQQDVEWLMAAHGGKASFVAHLDSLFTMELPDASIAHTEDVTRDGIIGNYVHGNEPSHHAAWMFALADRPDLTQYWTRKILRDMYGPGVSGLCGNDDAGQMSAWYLFASLGFYPLAPGEDRYILGSPSIISARLNLGHGKELHIATEGQAHDRWAVDRIEWNNETLNEPWITHSQLMQGGTLKFIFKSGPSASSDRQDDV